MHTIISLLLLTGIFIEKGYSQHSDTLKIGTVINKLPIQADSAKYLLYWDLPGDRYRQVALETRKIEQHQLNGKPTWVFIQKYQTEKGTDADTTYFNDSTLQPLAYRTHISSQGYRELVDFGTDVLTTKIIYADSVITNEQRIPYHYINAAMEDYVISKLPLQNHYSVCYYLLNPGKNHSTLYEQVTVSGTEKFILPDYQEVECWKLELNNGFSKTVAWYSKKDKTFLKKQFITAQRGSFIKVRLY